jgi:hypothetical protein
MAAPRRQLRVRTAQQGAAIGDLVVGPEDATPALHKLMKTIRTHNLLGLFLSLSLLCPRVAAAPMQAQLPESMAMNAGAGSGKWLIVTLRLETGEDLPFMVDTGSPVTILDKSLERHLGERLETMGLWFAATGMRAAGIYEAPKLYLGGTPLTTDRYIATYDLKPFSARSRQGIMGVLGLDCLRHYCMQLDFEAGKIRFLNSADPNTNELGKALSMTFSSRGQRFPPRFSSSGQNEALPYITQSGLAAGAGTNLLIDTGNNVDGTVEKGVIKGHYGTRFAHWLFPSRALRLRQCVWDGQTYTKLKVGTSGNQNQLGLRFLARHLVTLDFPTRTLYLKQTRSDPLDAQANR